MKNFNRFIFIAVFVLAASSLLAQINSQKTRWAVPGLEVDFTSSTPTTSTLTTGTIYSSINSYTIQDGPMLFQIADEYIKSPDGTNLANLGNPMDYMGPEVATCEVKNDCNSYITFFIAREYYSGLFIRESLCYSKYTRYPDDDTISMTASGSVLKSENQDALGGIALGQERADGSRFLYYASTNSTNFNGYVIKYTIDDNGNVDNGTTIYTGVTNEPFRMTELELSHDGSRLAFGRVGFGSYNNQDNDVVIFELNTTTGNLSSSAPEIINLGTNDAYYNYPGIEFSADGTELFVLESGVGLYKIDMSDYSAQSITGFDADYTNSMLELGRNGYYYLAKADGLYTMDDQGNIDPFASGTMQPNYILGACCTAYVLPDQIDGQDNKTYVTNTNCCYEHRESNFTSMSGVSENSTTGDITITGTNVYWSTTSNPFTSGAAITDIYLKGDLTIEPGARLNITGLTLHFKEGESLEMLYSTNASITGPKLYLYSGSKLTVFDECNENALWAGVNCSGSWGTGYEQTASPLLQPYVYMSNATIEFAEIGIEVACGGIVKAYNSDFVNNIMDVSFAAWQNYNNVSYFRLCDFTTTQALYDKGYNPSVHAKIWEAPGIMFAGCNFENTFAPDPSITPSQWGTGILSTNSFFNFNSYGSTFGSMSNLYYGVKANGGSYATINKCNFTDCCRGAWLIDCPAITVTQNNFNLSPEPLASNLYFDSFGLYVESSSGYQVESNDFYDGLTGVVVYNSGDANNFIYRNDFYDITSSNTLSASSISALGDNTNYPTQITDPEGLQISCNEFDNVDVSILVTGGTLNTYTGQISVNTADICQGQVYTVDQNNQSDLKVSAYNKFENISSTFSEVRYFHVNPTTSDILGNNEKYVYRQTNSPGYILANYNSNYVIVENHPANSCPSGILIFERGSIDKLMSQTQDFIQYESDLQAELDELTSYNKLQLEISAQTANEANTSEVYNELYDASPFLTTEILLSYLNNVNVSELSRTSLMIANSPLPNEVIKAVEISNLSSEYKSYIINNQDGENLVESLQKQVGSIKGARQVNYDKIVRATFNADTTPDFTDNYNSVLNFMEAQTDLHAMKKLADMYSHKGMISESNNILDNLENIAISNENEALFNHVQLERLKNDMQETHSMEASQNVIVENEEYLRELASDYNTKEGGAARAILESAGLWDNFPIVFLPNPKITMEDKSARLNSYEDSQELIPELESLFSIYPNPAEDYLSIEYINPDGNCTFSIYSIKGELIKTVSSNQSLGFVSIDISELDSGNYIISCTELNESKNFMIVR